LISYIDFRHSLSSAYEVWVILSKPSLFASMAYIKFLSDNSSKALVGIEGVFRLIRKVKWVDKIYEMRGSLRKHLMVYYFSKWLTI